MIYNVIEVCEPVLRNNEKNIPIHGAILEEFDHMKRVMVKVLSRLKGYGLRNVPYETAIESNIKCEIQEARAQTGKYMWHEDDTAVDMTSDENDTLVDTVNY